MEKVRSRAIVHPINRLIRHGQETSRPRAASHREAFAATAFTIHVRIAKLECLVQPVLHEIDLGAVDEAQALWIDDHLHAVAIEHDVIRVDRVRIVDRVGVARAAALAYADSEAHATAALREEAAHARRRALCQRDRHPSILCNLSLVTALAALGRRRRPRLYAGSRTPRTARPERCRRSLATGSGPRPRAFGPRPRRTQDRPTRSSVPRLFASNRIAARPPGYIP